MFWSSDAPAKIPGESVTPVYFFDDTALWRGPILYSMFAFDDILDPSKLRSSLETLARSQIYISLFHG